MGTVCYNETIHTESLAIAMLLANPGKRQIFAKEFTKEWHTYPFLSDAVSDEKSIANANAIAKAV